MSLKQIACELAGWPVFACAESSGEAGQISEIEEMAIDVNKQREAEEDAEDMLRLQMALDELIKGVREGSRSVKYDDDDRKFTQVYYVRDQALDKSKKTFEVDCDEPSIKLTDIDRRLRHNSYNRWIVNNKSVSVVDESWVSAMWSDAEKFTFENVSVEVQEKFNEICGVEE